MGAVAPPRDFLARLTEASAAGQGQEIGFMLERLRHAQLPHLLPARCSPLLIIAAYPPPQPELLEAARTLVGTVSVPLGLADPRGRTALIIAAQNGNVELCKVLVEAGADVNREDNTGGTALRHAVLGEQLGVVALLAGIAEVKLRLPDNEGLSPLQHAVDGGHVQALKAMLDRSTNAVIDPDEAGNSLLHRACFMGHTLVIDELLKHGAPVDHLNDANKTPLMVACERGPSKPENVALLVQGGASLEVRDGHGHTVLMLAARRGRADAVRALLTAGADAGAVSPTSKSTPLMLAVTGGHESAALELVPHSGQVLNLSSGKKNVTALHTACTKGLARVVAALLAAGADATLEDRRTFQAIHYAAYYDQAGCLRELLKGGVKPASSKGNVSPLHWAAFAGSVPCATLLLDMARIPVDVMDKDMATPLLWAAEHGHVAVAEYLLSRGAGVDAEDVFSSTPLGTASEHGHADVVTLLVGAGADLQDCDDKGRTPLHRASAKGRVAVVDVLIELGARIKLFDKRGFQPIHYAANTGSLSSMRSLHNAGASLDVRGAHGRTPLFWAVRSGAMGAVQWLLEQGADPKIMDKHGNTALLFASAEEKVLISSMLVEAEENQLASRLKKVKGRLFGVVAGSTLSSRRKKSAAAVVAAAGRRAKK